MNASACCFFFAAVLTGQVEVDDFMLVKFPVDADSVATAANGKGQAIGHYYVEDRPGIFRQQEFSWDVATGKITDIPFLDGYTAMRARAVNESGLVVGEAQRSPGDPGHLQAFVWSKQGTGELGFLPGDISSGASGINNRGDVVGWSISQRMRTLRACVWLEERKRPTPLPVTEAVSRAVGISQHRVIVGHDGRLPCMWLPVGEGQWEQQKIGSQPGRAVAVNNRSEVVGYLNEQGHERGFLFSADGRFILLDCQRALDINDQGWIAGFDEGPTLYVADQTRRLEDVAMPGEARAINNQGQIVGYLDETDERTEKVTAFLLTVPQAAAKP